jgi:hypothetical protein
MTAVEHPPVRTVSDGDGDGEIQRIDVVEEPPTFDRPSGLRRVWRQIPTSWKSVVLIGVIASAGWAAHAYAARYATRDDLREHVTGGVAAEQKIEELAKDMVAAKTEIAATRAEIAEVKKTVEDTAKATRDDIKTLTKYLIEHPTPRR